jgi:hypothetical protein
MGVLSFVSHCKFERGMERSCQFSDEKETLPGACFRKAHILPESLDIPGSALDILWQCQSISPKPHNVLQKPSYIRANLSKFNLTCCKILKIYNISS